MSLPPDFARQVRPDFAQQMPLDFTFSASSLQDYLDCPRRFQLRYLLRIVWPAAEAEPLEEAQAHRERGERFHRLVQGHAMGVAPQPESLKDPELARWWEAFLTHRPKFPGATWFHEAGLSIPLDDYRLVARYDAVAVEPDGPAHILDWKTYLRRPGRDQLRRRAQTRVYPLVLARAGASLCGGKAPRPEAVAMIYWFTAAPEHPERFAYDQMLLEEDEAYVRALVAEVVGRKEETWPLTEERRRCDYCVYRSLCDRGVRPGLLEGWEGEPEERAEDLAGLEWGQTQEIVY